MAESRARATSQTPACEPAPSPPAWLRRPSQSVPMVSSRKMVPTTYSGASRGGAAAGRGSVQGIKTAPGICCLHIGAGLVVFTMFVCPVACGPCAQEQLHGVCMCSVDFAPLCAPPPASKGEGCRRALPASLAHRHDGASRGGALRWGSSGEVQTGACKRPASVGRQLCTSAGCDATGRRRLAALPRHDAQRCHRAPPSADEAQPFQQRGTRMQQSILVQH